MIIRIEQPHTSARAMTEQYIAARYQCSLVEFARKLEWELREAQRQEREKPVLK